MQRPIKVPGGGEYIDADWSQTDRVFMAAVLQRPGRLTIYDHPNPDELMPLAWINLGRWALFLRFAVDDGGWCCAAAQDGRDPKPDGSTYPAIVVICDGNDRIFEVVCPVSAFGEGGVEVVGLETGWWVFFQTSPTMWWRGLLRRDGTWAQQIGFPLPSNLPEGTSQGFSQGSRDGTIRFMDVWRSTTPGLAKPNDDEGLVVGQNGDDGPDRIRGVHRGVTFQVYRGTAYEPHVVSNLAGTWMATARTPAGPAAVLLAAPFEPEIASAPQPPTPDPQPDPPQETHRMTIPEPVKATILAFAERFPLPSRDGGDEARRTWTMNLVSHLAFKFGQKWGSKSGDSGRPISKDSIAYQGDVLYGFDIVDGATMQLKWPNGMDLTNKTAENEFTAPQHFWAAGETDRQGHTIPPARDWLGTEPIPEPEPGPGETPIPNEPIPGGVAEILTTMLREQREFYAYLRARLK